MKLYLQNIVNDISFETLPITWREFNFTQFSKDKTFLTFSKRNTKVII